LIALLADKTVQALGFRHMSTFFHVSKQGQLGRGINDLIAIKDISETCFRMLRDLGM
jgi:hypothetical protein